MALYNFVLYVAKLWTKHCSRVVCCTAAITTVVHVVTLRVADRCSYNLEYVPRILYAGVKVRL